MLTIISFMPDNYLALFVLTLEHRAYDSQLDTGER
jgi:hypothetical protein